MSVIVCSFAGWIQIRLATNPDPPDEPRGISGQGFHVFDGGRLAAGRERQGVGAQKEQLVHGLPPHCPYKPTATGA